MKEAESKREIKMMKNMESNRASRGKNKLRMLRSITNSHAHSKTSIILDATKYLEELKQRIEKVNQHVALAQNSTFQKSYPVQLRVEAEEKGFLIKVLGEGCCPGLLVFILEAFEELGIDVLQARVSCSDCFHLEALLGVKDDQGSKRIDVEQVQEVVSQAIQNWTTQQQ